MNYHMPAEWQPHEGTWLAWPHNEEHWPGNIAPVPHTYVEIIHALAESEKVFVCVNDEKMEREARNVMLSSSKHALSSNIFFHRFPTNASWSRDHGPIFVRDSRDSKSPLTVLDFAYNGNGKKWGPFDLDDAIPQKVAAHFALPLVQPGIILEGGSIDVNGLGTLLTTEGCLLNKNRNPNLSRAQIEKYLHDYLGATNVLWLKEGVVGDDTDGHVDDIARFVNETTVVCAVEKNPDDINYQALKENFELLKKMKDQDGRPLDIVPLPMPAPVFYEGERLPASYANFYIANTVVLVPTFACPQDQEAIAILQKFFPTREVKGIDCRALVWGLGTIHCSTQQMPRKIE